MTDLDELEALLAAATQGEWKAGRADMATIVEGYESKWIYADGHAVAVASGRISDDWDVVMANANLIAALHNAAPDLIAAARRVKVLEEALRPFADFAPYVEMFVEGRANFPGNNTLATKHFRQAHFQAARAALGGTNE
jgi:hypothetical protein